MIQRSLLYLSLLAFQTIITSCGTGGGSTARPGLLGPEPTITQRNALLAAEPKGDFYYGRRYFVERTRLWGYLRKPGKSYSSSGRLVLLNEDIKRAPDRVSETSGGYGADQNYEYRIYGSYTGKKGYDPNSNLFLPIFRLSNYQLIDKQPGWIFSPQDYYDPKSFTLRNQ